MFGAFVNMQNFRKAEYPVYSYPTYLESDVALLRLKHGVDLANSPNINSICWPTVTPHDGQQVIATGWGIKFQGMRQYGKSQLLQKVRRQSIFDCFVLLMSYFIHRPQCPSLVTKHANFTLHQSELLLCVLGELMPTHVK